MIYTSHFTTFLYNHLSLFGIITCIWAGQVSAHTYQFDTAAQEAQYAELIHELRCVVCQNQNIADSNAKLAQDLRDKVQHLLVHEQANKQQILDYVVARYGEFVLYRPPLIPQTWLLWFAPVLFLLFGAWISWRIWQQQHRQEIEP